MVNEKGLNDWFVDLKLPNKLTLYNGYNKSSIKIKNKNKKLKKNVKQVWEKIDGESYKSYECVECGYDVELEDDFCSGCGNQLCFGGLM